MAYLATINVVAHDTKPEIMLALKNKNQAKSGMNLDEYDENTWAPINLTGAEVVVKFRKLGSKEILDTLSCIKQTPLENGVCYMQWNTNTLDVEAGTYEGEVEISYTGTNTLTLFDRIKFKVRDDF